MRDALYQERARFPKVSVIMPAYNAEKYIAESIESILNQTFGDFEFIILDDASSDGTWDIINSYAQKDSRIFPVKNERNLNIAENRNKGLALAKGEYIVWQDADDISLPTRIEKLVNYMDSHPKVGICGSYIQSFNEKGDLDVRVYAEEDKLLRRTIFKFSPVSQPAAIVRREVFEQVGNFNAKYPPAEDLDLSFRIGEFYEFGNIPEVLFRYREHSESTTQKNLAKQIKFTLEIRKRFFCSRSYSFDFSDIISYCLAWISQFLPVRVTIPLFKLCRKILGY